MTTSAIIQPAISPLVTAGSPGVGDDLQHVEALLGDVVGRLLSSVSLSKQVQDVLRQLYRVLEDCGRSNWDGYGAQPILFETFEKAKLFAQALPFGIPAPEVSADPDGEPFNGSRLPQESSQ